MSRQITINDILKMFLAHIKLIIIMAIIGTILAYVYVSYFVTPIYTTSALLLVQNDAGFSLGGSTADPGDTDSERINTNDITQSVMLANTCTVLFTKDPDMKSIIAGNSVTITAIEESYFLEIKASASDPLAAANVANAVAQAAPEVFAKYFGEAGKVDTVDEAAIPSKPSSPNVERYVMMGFLAGLVLALGISFLIEIIDTTVKPGDDLYDMYEIPVFAEIIDFDVEGGAKKR
ncbi:MAG: hypothetical protein E7513_02130 [Ruminococcaceae bacterium]|nr:hypothetical protein [Oscillospiraceae bacterium]